VTSECLRADMPDYELADFLLKVANWKTKPLKQIFEGGKGGRTLKGWLVGADQAPELAMYYAGSTPLHIKPMLGGSTEAPGAPKASSKAAEEPKGKGKRVASRAQSRRRSRPAAPPPGTIAAPPRTLPKVNLADTSPEGANLTEDFSEPTLTEPVPPSTDVEATQTPVAQQATQGAAASQDAIAAPTAPADNQSTVEMKAQIASLAKGQADLAQQMTNLIATLNTIDFAALPRLAPHGEAHPPAGEEPKAAAQAAQPKVSPMTPSSARASPPESFEETQFSRTLEVPSLTPNAPELAPQDPTPRESLKARSNTPSRQLVRNASADLPAAKHAKGPDV
jgi:hypothetical protein